MLKFKPCFNIVLKRTNYDVLSRQVFLLWCCETLCLFVANNSWYNDVYNSKVKGIIVSFKLSTSFMFNIDKFWWHMISCRHEQQPIGPQSANHITILFKLKSNGIGLCSNTFSLQMSLTFCNKCSQITFETAKSQWSISTIDLRIWIPYPNILDPPMECVLCWKSLSVLYFSVMDCIRMVDTSPVRLYWQQGGVSSAS